jgi:hypothetical protein
MLRGPSPSATNAAHSPGTFDARPVAATSTSDSIVGITGEPLEATDCAPAAQRGAEGELGDLTEQSNDLESREGREYRHGIGLYSQSRIHDSTRRPITLADDNLRGPENRRTMRFLDARNHRQGDGDQGSRLTALSRRCVRDEDPRRRQRPPGCQRADGAIKSPAPIGTARTPHI